jgi:two-component system, OmpR family, phosphate regulon response regulator PhoB
MPTRILIVEDEEPLTMILRYNLESEGYAVDTSGAGTRPSCGSRRPRPTSR